MLKTSKMPIKHPVRVALWVVLILVVVSGCQIEENLEEVPKIQSTEKVNPYSADNVGKALENIIKSSNGRIKVALPSSTHNYVRFQPQNLS